MQYYDLKIFTGIEKETVDYIINNCTREKFQTGEMILIEGEDSNGEGYIIESGEVKVSWNKGNTTKILGKGEIFGEIALLNEETRTANIEATKKLEVIVLSQPDIVKMLNSDDNSINKAIIQRIEENLGLH